MDFFKKSYISKVLLLIFMCFIEVNMFEVQAQNKPNDTHDKSIIFSFPAASDIYDIFGDGYLFENEEKEFFRNICFRLHLVDRNDDFNDFNYMNISDILNLKSDTPEFFLFFIFQITKDLCEEITNKKLLLRDVDVIAISDYVLSLLKKIEEFSEDDFNQYLIDDLFTEYITVDKLKLLDDIYYVSPSDDTIGLLVPDTSRSIR